MPFSCCALFLYNDESETLRCRFATGVEADIIQTLTIRNGHGLTGWVARNRRPLVNARPSADFEAAGLPSDQTSLHSALVCPLVFNERFIGTISVYHIEPSVYTDDHRRLLDRISEQAAAVIYNSIVFEQTQEDSLTDPLTGLPNTRFMFMHLTRELARAERLKSEVSLLVMDLDNFKEINDTYGHHIGDRALRDVAGVLRAAIRPYDICVRYAGDEFIVVLSGCGGEEAERKRVELQRAVDSLPFEPRPGRALPLAISVGAAIFPHDGDTLRSAARDGRQPDVPRQDAAQAASRTRRAHRAARPPKTPASPTSMFSDPRSASSSNGKKSELAERQSRATSTCYRLPLPRYLIVDPVRPRPRQSGPDQGGSRRSERRGPGLEPPARRIRRRTRARRPARPAPRRRQRRAAGAGRAAESRRERAARPCVSIILRAPHAGHPGSAPRHAARAHRPDRSGRRAVRLHRRAGGAGRHRRRTEAAVFGGRFPRRDAARRLPRAARGRRRERQAGTASDARARPARWTSTARLARSRFHRRPIERRFVFIAGGTGIAPLRAMLRHALAIPHEQIGLFYSARTPGRVRVRSRAARAGAGRAASSCDRR